MTWLHSITCASALVSLLASGTAADAVGWRHDGTGRFPEADPPTAWSTEENVGWKTRLPGPSHASPILVGDRLFVVSQPTELIAVDRATGEILWQRSHTYADLFGAEKAASIEADLKQAGRIRQEIGERRKELDALNQSGNPNPDEVRKLEEQIAELEAQKEPFEKYPAVRQGANGNTTATPACDGERVFTVTGTGIVSAHSLDGERLWMKHVEKPWTDWGNTTSPLVIDGKLIVHLNEMVALDPQTGEEIWRTEANPRFGSPVASTIGSDVVLVTADGAIIRAADGKLLAEKLFALPHGSPIVHEGVVYVADGEARALQLPSSISSDDKVELEELWTAKISGQRRFASPVYHDGLLYGVSDQGILDVLDAETGERVYRERLSLGNGNVYPSVTMAGGLIYVGSESGTMVVIRPGREYEEVARNEFEGFSAAPVFDEGCMYLRCKEHLVCIR